MERVKSIVHSTVELTHSLVLKGRTVIDAKGDVFANRVYADEVYADHLRIPYEPTLSDLEKHVLGRLVGGANRFSGDGSVSLGGKGNEVHGREGATLGCVDCAVEADADNATLVGCFETEVGPGAMNATVIGGNNVSVEGPDCTVLGSNVRCRANGSVVLSAGDDTFEVSGGGHVVLCGSNGTLFATPAATPVVPPGFACQFIVQEEGRRPVWTTWFRDSDGALWCDERTLRRIEVAGPTK